MKIYVFFFLQCLFVSAFGTTIVVRQSTGNDFLSAIQRAAAHDTILLKHGIYKEHDIVVKKPLVIISREGAKIDGEGKYQLLILNHDSIVVEGITFQNSGSSGMTDMAGVKAVTADHVVLSNNIFLNTTYGIYLQNCSYTTIVGNQIKGRAADELNNGNGIHAWKSGHLLIRDNDVTGQRDGIYFEFVTDSRIFHNNSHDNVRYGLHFMFSHRDRYAQNSFVDNESGVAVMYSKFVEMTDNVFRHNWGEASYGILLKEISDSKQKFFENNLKILNEQRQQDEANRTLIKDKLSNMALLDPTQIPDGAKKEIDDFYGIPGFTDKYININAASAKAKIAIENAGGTLTLLEKK